MDAMYDPWSTHLPALASAVHRFGERVLEIGAGWYSTPLLYAMSPSVVTLETNVNWAVKFASLTCGRIQVVPNMVQAVKQWAVHPWDVVFIDCEGDPLRVACAHIFLDRECCIVAHDTEAPYWNKTLSIAKYKRHFDFVMPRTTWMSNVLDVNNHQ